MAVTAPFPDAARMQQADVSHDAEAARRIIRRRPTQTQGQALEKLGRAIEYLMDSRLVLIEEPSTKADADALEILMRLNRCVFSECKEVVPMKRRLKEWITAKMRSH